MKIPSQLSIPFLEFSSREFSSRFSRESVAAKKEGQGGAGREQYQSDGRKKDARGQGRAPAEFEEVASAVDDFANEQPLDGPRRVEASVSGKGPGLRVVLRDQGGGIIRQLSGEEFLRLREAAAEAGTRRGKILDQKG
jgi:hypothetical protein